MSTALAAPSLLTRLSAVIDLLSRGLAASALTHREASLVAWTRLRRLLARFASLVAAAEAGRVFVRRPRTGAAPRPRISASAVRLPGGAGWLLKLAPALDTRIGRSQLECLLGAPELQALLARAPQAGRLLRPLCHALRIEPPPALRLPRRERSPRRRDRSGSTEAGTAGGEARPARRLVPPLWLTRPAAPPLLTPEGMPVVDPPYPARTGPPRT